MHANIILYAHTLHILCVGNNIMSAYFGQKVHEYDGNRKIRVLFRILASVPPLLGASVVSDLGRITNFTGILYYCVQVYSCMCTYSL